MSPINLDPEKPAMPVSHPSYYSMYLAKRIGPYATLGLAEDTWALNEGVTDERIFLQQTYDIDRERQDMFFAALNRLRTGTLVCVFDATDRIQHMFWRYLDANHPARQASDDEPRERHRGSLSTQRCAGRPRHGPDRRGRCADGGVGPWLQLVPAWRQSQRVAVPGGLSRAQTWRRQRRRVAARRGLVEDTGVRGRPDRDVPQSQGTRSTGSR